MMIFDFYTNVRERERERIERERSEIKKESKKYIRYIALPPGLRSSRTCQVQKIFPDGSNGYLSLPGCSEAFLG